MCPRGEVGTAGQASDTDLWRSGSVCWGRWSLGSRAHSRPPLGTGTTGWAVRRSVGPAHPWSEGKVTEHREPLYPDVPIRPGLETRALISPYNTALPSPPLLEEGSPSCSGTGRAVGDQGMPREGSNCLIPFTGISPQRVKAPWKSKSRDKCLGCFKIWWLNTALERFHQ